MQTAGPYGGLISPTINVVLVGTVACYEGVESLGDCEPKEWEGATAACFAGTGYHYGGVASEDGVGLAGIADVDGGEGGGSLW